MNRQPRRTNRRISDEESRQLLADGEYGVLSTVDEDNQPYGVPVSYVVAGETLYIHSALEGHKLENIAANAQVSFCVVGKTELLPGKFSTNYESVILFGRARVLDAAEKRQPLQAILSKYSAAFPEAGERYVDKLIHKTAVIAVTIGHLSGKARRG